MAVSSWSSESSTSFLFLSSPLYSRDCSNYSFLGGEEYPPLSCHHPCLPSSESSCSDSLLLDHETGVLGAPVSKSKTSMAPNNFWPFQTVVTVMQLMPILGRKRKKLCLDFVPLLFVTAAGAPTGYWFVIFHMAQKPNPICSFPRGAGSFYAPVVTCRAFLMVISIHSKAHAKSTLAFTLPNPALHQSVAYNRWCSYCFAVICMAEGSYHHQHHAQFEKQ